MKLKLISLPAVLCSLVTFAQINFEPGYFIDNSGEKIDCLIKNVDWEKNPESFKYRLTNDEKIHSASIEEVSEFAISSSLKYIRHTVQIDTSSYQINNLSISRDPLFDNRTVFLKVLVEGDLSLFMFRETNESRYFIKSANREIEPLIYKRYQSAPGRVGENKKFQLQLRAYLQCDDINKNLIEQVSYARKQLEKLILKYNSCVQSESTYYGRKSIKKKQLSLTIRPGIGYHSLSIERGDKSTDYVNISTQLDGKLSFRVGLEAELFLPFNNNKWSLIMEPTYSSYNVVKKRETSEAPSGSVTVDYSFMELPIGLRHSFYLSDKSLIFLNSQICFAFNFESSIAYERSITFEGTNRLNLTFGVGFKSNKYSIETRFSTRREIIADYVYYKSNYQGASLIFGYKLF